MSNLGFGNSWWSEAWLKSLENQDPDRMQRGARYATQSKVKNMEIEGGQVRAQVFGSRQFPYDTEIVFAPFEDEARILIEQLFKRSPDTLERVLPYHWQEVLQENGHSLIPDPVSQMSLDCNCPDWGWPCKHLAATCCELAYYLDQDPWLLLRLQGLELSPPLENKEAPRPDLESSWQQFWQGGDTLTLELPLTGLTAPSGRLPIEELAPLRGLSRKRLIESLEPVYQEAAHWATKQGEPSQNPEHPPEA